MCGLLARLYINLITDGNFSGFNLTLEAAERVIRTAYALYRHIEAFIM